MSKVTPSQRNALHVYCENLATALNDAGYEMKAVMAVKEMDVPWTKESVKEVLYKPLLKVMTGKASTEDMDTVQPSDVYEVLHRHMASNFGINVTWPSNEPPMEDI